VIEEGQRTAAPRRQRCKLPSLGRDESGYVQPSTKTKRKVYQNEQHRAEQSGSRTADGGGLRKEQCAHPFKHPSTISEQPRAGWDSKPGHGAGCAHKRASG
jgi:hypothetical protein